MTTVQLTSYFFGAFSIGWCISYAFLAFKKLSEVST